MKTSKGLCLLFLCTQLGFSFIEAAEVNRNPEVRYGSIQEYKNRQALLKNAQSSKMSADVSHSDLGLQRPVETKDKGLGYYFGFESKILHSNNPGASPNPNGFLDSAGIWENSISNNFLLGAYDFGGASFTPLLGIGLINSSYFGNDALKVLNSNNLNLNFLCIFQFSEGWSIRGGLSSFYDFNSQMIQTYRQTSPTFGLTKDYNLGPATMFIDLSFSYHFTDTYSDLQANKMNRLESALLFGVEIPIKNFEVSPYLRFCAGNYSNQNRDEITTNFGLDASYRFYDWLAIKSILSYCNRNASGPGGEAADFSRFDIGTAVSIDARF